LPDSASSPGSAEERTSDSLEPGSCGTVTSVTVPAGQRTFLAGPRGVLVFVAWDDGPVLGVSPRDLKLSET
jgi:hypothetical protein